MKTKFLLPIVAFFMLFSCVSKKKYNALQDEYTKTYAKLEQINAKVNAYYERINALSSQNQTLSTTNSILSEENANKFDYVENVAVLSKNQRKKLERTLQHVDQEKLSKANTLEDSINLALSHNLSKSMENEEGIDVDINNTVVMINVSDELLFQPGSFNMSTKSKSFLKKLSDLINSEPSIDVIVEGHTDSMPIKKSKDMAQDNWELSVKRSVSIIRKLQNTYGVDPKRLIASGRSSYLPIADNSTYKGRALNRRTRIILVPDLNKFFALLDADEVAAVDAVDVN